MAEKSESTQPHAQAARDSELLRTLLKHIPDRIYFKDAESRFLLVSQAMVEFFGLENAGQLEGKTDFDFFSPEHANPAFADEQHIMKTGEPIVGKFEEERLPDGRVGWASTTKLPLRDSQGQIIGTFGISRDVTERKQAEDERAKANAALAKRKSELVNAMEELRRSEAELRTAHVQLFQADKLASLGQLVAGVAHEINNPLSFVSNNVAVLQRDLAGIKQLLGIYQEADGILAAANPQLFERIGELSERLDLAYTMTNLNELLVRSRDGLKRIQQIVKDLRDFARLDESDLHEVDLNSGIESTVNIIRGRAKDKQVSIDLDLQPLPLLACYPAKINQVIMNLVANAIDACPADGKVTIKTLKMPVPEPAGSVRIEVHDTGAGIDPAIRQRIFDPFFTTKSQGEGTGLGLSISYGIIRDHHGTIEVESTLGEGSRFAVTLPVHKAVRNT